MVYFRAIFIRKIFFKKFIQYRKILFLSTRLALKKAQEEAHAAVPAPKKAKAKGRPKKAAKKPRKGRK